MKKLFKIGALLAATLLASQMGLAQEAAAAAEEAPKYADLDAFSASPGYSLFTANNVWMMLCAGLVFIMHLGFATVETGLTRSKNTVNILFKNALIPCI